MPNINLLPHPERDVPLEELIDGVENGIMIDGSGSFSIDQQRYNSQYGGQVFWEIRNGRVTGMLKDVAYQIRTPEFWNSMDLIGGPSTYFIGGTRSATGRGSPRNRTRCRTAACRRATARSTSSTPDGTRIGERFIDERVTIYSDPGDPRLFTSPFNNEGVPNQRMTWVENGVLRNLVYDRFWAAQHNRQPSGFVSGYHMTGGNDTLDDMIRSTERGLLLTRFWYIRGVDPRTILFTGLTRDGTFLIENGRVVHPVQNLRWNESPIFMLNNIEMMGAPVRISSGESAGLTPAVIVPPLKVRDFSFTSLSDAV
jgi:predicted Zn-dependent protease